MKKLFFSLVAMMIATVSYAQNTLVATLSHNSDITMYYGVYALRDAMNAAESGDVINLSGGAFQAVDITKAVSLRGTGIDVTDPTYIINSFSINIPAEDANRLSMEGIRCTGRITVTGSFAYPFFFKSQFNEIVYDANSSIYSSTYVNCKIIGNYFNVGGSSSVQLVNCYMTGGRTSDNSTVSFINCVISPYVSYSKANFDLMARCGFLNCIFFNIPSFTQKLPSTCHALNCIATGSAEIFDNIASRQNCVSSSYQEVFKDFTGSYTDAQTFVLSEEAKTKFIGTDGTEIGMYGGLMPYSSTPSYPQITKMNVANKTTADGKLSVEIEVSAAQ